MIRDADKLDHFRVKDVEKDTVLLGVTYEEAGKESITDEVYQQFCDHQLIYGPSRKTHLDMWISYIAFIFDLYFDESKTYIEKNHYIERSFDKIKIEKEENNVVEAKALMEFIPDTNSILQKLVPMFITNSIFQALLEASASELASRMTAMSAASKNAEEMINNLTVSYNKARQSAITQELIEIVSGASAQK